MNRLASDRICCDGLCQQGQPCPVLRYPRRKTCPAPAMQLAPGVIDGPHKPAKPRLVLWLQRVAAKTLKTDEPNKKGLTT